MNTTSPKSSLAKLGIHTTKHKSLKVMVLGQSGVGKSGKINIQNYVYDLYLCSQLYTIII